MNRSNLSSSFNASLPDNTSGLITPAVLRSTLVEIIDNVVFPEDSGSGAINTGSFATTGSNNFVGTQIISGSIKFGNNTQQITITGADTDLTYPNSQRMVVQGTQGTGSYGEGGDIYLWAGAGSYDNGSGGDIKLRGGWGYNNQGGYIKMQGGNSSGQGGYILIEGGSGNNGNNGGDVTIRTQYGYNGGTSGKLYLQSPLNELTIEDSIIKTANEGSDVGLKLDFASNEYTFGDYNGTIGDPSGIQTSTGLVTISSSDVINLNANYGSISINSFINSIGDLSANDGNKTKIIIDDPSQTIQATGSVEITGSLTVNGNNIDRPYKVYTALLNQTGTNPPVATVLENTLGDITYMYEDAGSYYITSDGLFTTNKTWAIGGTPVGYNTNIVISFDSNSLGFIGISYGDGLLQNSPIEIRVYN